MKVGGDLFPDIVQRGRPATTIAADTTYAWGVGFNHGTVANTDMGSGFLFDNLEAF